MQAMLVRLATCCLLAALAAPAAGQTVEAQGFRPVDQRVEDVDPLAVSLRQEQTGLRTTGERNNVFRRVDPFGGDDAPVDPRRLYYISEGVVAEFDRSDYAALSLRDRRVIVQLIPPNTVFHVGLPRTPQPITGFDARPPSPLLVSGRLDGQVNPATAASGPGRFADSPTFAQRQADYAATAAAQRAITLRSLDRLAGATPP
jgi:hypothetical protein